jgi:hypothetical protein
MPIPQRGDILIRAWLSGTYSLIDVISREHVAGPFNDFAEAVAEARNRTVRAIWEQYFDARGRPLGYPFHLADINI